MARAGWCSQCGANVWLTAEGGCPNGHAPAAIVNAYEAGVAPATPAAVPRPTPAAGSPATPPAAPRKTPRALVIVLVVVGLLLCLIAAAVGAAVAFYLPVGSETGQVDEDMELPEEPIIESTPASAMTIREESEAVAEALRSSDEGWAQYITGVEVITWLRRPLIVVSTNIGPEQADTAEDLSNGIASSPTVHSSPGGDEYTYFIRFLSSEGDSMGGMGSTDDRWALEDAPSPPAEAQDLYVWLDEVYGSKSPAAEAWFGRIIGIASEADDPDGYVVVRTDLDPNEPADLEVAESIIGAVNSSGATFAPGIRIYFGDGAYEWSGMLDGTDPYGM